MSATAKHLDFTPPPVVKRLGQRLMVAGVVLAVISIALAFWRPDEFYRAYLLAFMDWLGVTLGSMAIIMIRHLTGGGWGVVIRRVQGAAMRTLPVVTVLFIPIVIAVMQGRVYPWASRSTRFRTITSASTSRNTASSKRITLICTASSFARSFISRSGTFSRSCCRSGRQKAIHPPAATTRNASSVSVARG